MGAELEAIDPLPSPGFDCSQRLLRPVGSDDGRRPQPPLALKSAATAVFVGERTSLPPVFDGDFASIDGIGRVQSGVAVDTPLFRLIMRVSVDSAPLATPSPWAAACQPAMSTGNKACKDRTPAPVINSPRRPVPQAAPGTLAHAS